MIRIDKGNEPREWQEKRKTPGATYEAIPTLRDALLAEQGYICAYCMRRIPLAKSDPGNPELSRIDHIRCRRDNPDLQLVYSNMVICCPGCINGEDHCDKSKNDSDIRFSPFDQNLENSVSYSSKDGEIKSCDEAWNTDFNEVLKLNNAMLKLNRLGAIEAVRMYLEKKKWRPAELQQTLEIWEAKDNNNQLKPYCGVVRWYLRKKIRATK
jgi:uncharacterized protein (TIGR02646 family)